MTVHIIPVHDIPEIEPGDDLAQIIDTAAEQLHDGDILAVTSKIVSKAENRYMSDRTAAIESQTVEVVAAKADTRIVRTPTGLVLAAAGVDASNIADDRVLLLPEDPDRSAAQLRAALYARRGVDVAVIITDTLGRAWRTGQIDTAIGVAGMSPLRDLRGETDMYGKSLGVTIPAIADELASAADLVKGKSSAIPVAIIRGVDGVGGEDGPGAAALVRDSTADMFRYGTAESRAVGHKEAVALRRTVRQFSELAVDPDAISRAVAAAVTAPAPHHTTPWRFVHVARQRHELLTAMRDAWTADLKRDGWSDAAIQRRISRGDVLWQAPELVIPGLVRSGAHQYPDSTRGMAEHDMFTVAMGAGVQNFLVSLAAEQLGSAWISSTMFCPETVRNVLALDDDFCPMGAVAIGHPLHEPDARPPREIEQFLWKR